MTDTRKLVETPRTDAVASSYGDGYQIVPAEFSRQLERALTLCEAERKKVEEDAARYRFLREAARVSEDGTVSVGGGVLLADPPSISPMSDAEQLDAAINAALKAQR